MGQKVVVTVEFPEKAKDVTNCHVGIYGENCEAMMSACRPRIEFPSLTYFCMVVQWHSYWQMLTRERKLAQESSRK